MAKLTTSVFGLVFDLETDNKYDILNNHLGIRAEAHDESILKQIIRDFRTLSKENGKFRIQIAFTSLWYFCDAFWHLYKKDIYPEYAPTCLDVGSIQPTNLHLSTQTKNTFFQEKEHLHDNNQREILNVDNVPGFLFRFKHENDDQTETNEINKLENESIFFVINLNAYKLNYHYDKKSFDSKDFDLCQSEIVLQIPIQATNLANGLQNVINLSYSKESQERRLKEMNSKNSMKLEDDFEFDLNFLRIETKCAPIIYQLRNEATVWDCKNCSHVNRLSKYDVDALMAEKKIFGQMNFEKLELGCAICNHVHAGVLSNKMTDKAFEKYYTFEIKNGRNAWQLDIDCQIIKYKRVTLFDCIMELNKEKRINNDNNSNNKQNRNGGNGQMMWQEFDIFECLSVIYNPNLCKDDCKKESLIARGLTTYQLMAHFCHCNVFNFVMKDSVSIKNRLTCELQDLAKYAVNIGKLLNNKKKNHRIEIGGSEVKCHKDKMYFGEKIRLLTRNETLTFENNWEALQTNVKTANVDSSFYLSILSKFFNFENPCFIDELDFGGNDNNNNFLTLAMQASENYMSNFELQKLIQSLNYFNCNALQEKLDNFDNLEDESENEDSELTYNVVISPFGIEMNGLDFDKSKNHIGLNNLKQQRSKGIYFIVTFQNEESEIEEILIAHKHGDSNNYNDNKDEEKKNNENGSNDIGVNEDEDVNDLNCHFMNLGINYVNTQIKIANVSNVQSMMKWKGFNFGNKARNEILLPIEFESIMNDDSKWKKNICSIFVTTIIYDSVFYIDEYLMQFKDESKSAIDPSSIVYKYENDRNDKNDDKDWTVWRYHDRNRNRNRDRDRDRYYDRKFKRSHSRSSRKRSRTRSRSRSRSRKRDPSKHSSKHRTKHRTKHRNKHRRDKSKRNELEREKKHGSKRKGGHSKHNKSRTKHSHWGDSYHDDRGKEKRRSKHDRKDDRNKREKIDKSDKRKQERNENCINEDKTMDRQTIEEKQVNKEEERKNNESKKRKAILVLPRVRVAKVVNNNDNWVTHEFDNGQEFKTQGETQKQESKTEECEPGSEAIEEAPQEAIQEGRQEGRQERMEQVRLGWQTHEIAQMQVEKEENDKNENGDTEMVNENRNQLEGKTSERDEETGDTQDSLMTAKGQQRKTRNDNYIDSDSDNNSDSDDDKVILPRPAMDPITISSKSSTQSQSTTQIQSQTQSNSQTDSESESESESESASESQSQSGSESSLSDSNDSDNDNDVNMTGYKEIYGIKIYDRRYWKLGTTIMSKDKLIGQELNELNKLIERFCYRQHGHNWKDTRNGKRFWPQPFEKPSVIEKEYEKTLSWFDDCLQYKIVKNKKIEIKYIDHQGNEKIYPQSVKKVELPTFNPQCQTKLYFLLKMIAQYQVIGGGLTAPPWHDSKGAIRKVLKKNSNSNDDDDDDDDDDLIMYQTADDFRKSKQDNELKKSKNEMKYKLQLPKQDATIRLKDIIDIDSDSSDCESSHEHDVDDVVPKIKSEY